MQIRLLALALVSSIAVPARAAVIDVAPTDDLRALLATAQPGDEFVLAAGTYNLGTVRTAISVSGTSSAPVIVRSGPSGRATLTRSAAGQDVLVIENSAYVTLRGLELVGGNRGVDIVGSDQVVIEQCLIHGAVTDGVAAATGNGTVAQNSYVGIVVRDNDIYDVGSAAVRLGCDDPFICSTSGARVERNEVYGIAGSGVAGGGIRVGPGSSGLTVRDNAVHDAAGPAISVLGEVTGSIIERNGMWDITGAGIEITRGAVVRNNVVFDATEFGVRTVVASASVGALRIVNNTVIGASGIQVGQPQSDVVVANNALYASGTAIAVSGNASAVTFTTNVGTGSTGALANVLAAGGSASTAFVNAAGLNAHLRSGSPLIGAGTTTLQPADDFDGRARGASADVGAYAFIDGDDGAGGLPASGGSADPGVGGGGVTPGPARSEEGCAAAMACWPLVFAWIALYGRRMTRATALLGALLVSGSAHAAIIPVGPADDFRALVNSAQPGDEVVLAAGTYDLSANRVSIMRVGTASAPIIVRAASGARPILIRDNDVQNLLNIEDSAYVTLRGLELVGGLAGIAIARSDDITIEDCLIHGTTGEGITASFIGGNAAESTYDTIVVRRNELHTTGSSGSSVAIRLGCNESACTAPAAVIERNYIHDLVMPTASSGGIRVLGNSAGVVVRDNVLHDLNGVGIRFDADAAGSVIERNALWNIPDDGVSVTRGVAVRNNIVIAANGQALRMGPSSTTTSGDCAAQNNTFIGSSGIRVGPIEAPVVIANNAVYTSEVAIHAVGDVVPTFAGNVGIGSLSNVSGVLAPGGTLAEAFVDVGVAVDGDGRAHATALDAYPKAGSALVGAANAAQQPEDDFNTTPRSGSQDAGAYVFAVAGNPGWQASESAKTFPAPADDDGGPAGDGGPSDDGAPDDDGAPIGDGGPTEPSGPGDGDSDTGGAGIPDAGNDDGDGCATAAAAWPVMLALGVYLSRRRRA